LNNVACTGSEDSLAECSRSYFGDVNTHCKEHSKDASVYCGSKYCEKSSIQVILMRLILAGCPDSMFECITGRVDGQQPPCISNGQRCNNVKDCLEGEDELDHSCPCGPELCN